MGEAWHNNHHAWPASRDAGRLSGAERLGLRVHPAAGARRLGVGCANAGEPAGADGVATSVPPSPRLRERDRLAPASQGEGRRGSVRCAAAPHPDAFGVCPSPTSGRGVSRYPNAFRSSSLTTPGLAFPPIAFIVCPTKKAEQRDLAGAILFQLAGVLRQHLGDHSPRSRRCRWSASGPRASTIAAVRVAGFQHRLEHLLGEAARERAVSDQRQQLGGALRRHGTVGHILVQPVERAEQLARHPVRCRPRPRAGI